MDDMHDLVGHDLVGAYALDALDESERVAYEAHLAGCDECQTELASLQESAVVLAGSVSVTPPPALKDRVMAEVRGEPAPVAPLETRRPRSRPGWTALAVAALAALVLGVVALVQTVARNDLTGPGGVVAAAEAAASQPGAIVADFETEEGVVGQIVLTADGEGFMIPSDLTPLDEERTYQLWVVTPDEQVISAGVLGNDPLPSRFTWTGDVAGFALSREVAGGVESSAGDVVSVAEV
jgi:anti-sigma-K factor RskA